VQLAYSTLDGEGFESKEILLLQATRPLTQEWRLRVRYRFHEINGLDGFEGLDGTRHELAVRGMWRRDRWNVTVQYRYDTTDYRAEELSFDRHQLLVNALRDLNEYWTVEAGLLFDRSRYDVADNSAEDRTEVELGLSRSFGQRWRAVMRYSYADNRPSCPSSTTSATASRRASKRTGDAHRTRDLTFCGRRCFHALQRGRPCNRCTALFSWQLCWQVPPLLTRRRVRRTASRTCRACGRTTPRRRSSVPRCFRAAPT
jgi:hypothetical protein